MQKILIIGRDETEKNALQNMLASAGYEVFGTLTHEEAFRLFNSIHPNAVVVSNSINPMAKELIETKFLAHSGTTPVVIGDEGSILEQLRIVL